MWFVASPDPLALAKDMVAKMGIRELNAGIFASTPWDVCHRFCDYDTIVTILRYVRLSNSKYEHGIGVFRPISSISGPLDLPSIMRILLLENSFARESTDCLLACLLA